MLHILLMILKTAGMILLILLGILLAILLLVLFVPVRYRAEGKKDDTVMSGSVRVSWLLHFITGIISYQEETVSVQFRILGIDLMKLFNKKKSSEKAIRSDTTETLPEEAVVPQKEEQVKNVQTKAALVPEESKETEGVQEKKGFFEKVRSLWNKVSKTCKKIKLTIINICDKIRYWKAFLSDERTKEAVLLVKDHLLKLLGHILPRKIKGEVVYGFEDPCTTGQMLAGISVFYPVYYKQMQIVPDFSGAVLKGEVFLKGRIYMVVLLKSAVQIFFNKNIQFVIHIFRSKEES